MDKKPAPTRQGKSLNLQWLWLLPILMVVGYGVFNTKSSPVATSSKEKPPVVVEVGTLKTGAAQRKVRLQGEIEASQRTLIRAQTDGVVKEILVQVGSSLESGDTIAILDNADQRLAVAAAKARLAEEQSKLERLQIGTRQEILAQRQAEVKSALAKEQEAQNNLQSLIILQPTLIAATQAQVKTAIAREKETLDNLTRIQQLIAEGALGERELVKAQSEADAATGERLRAEANLASQQTQSQQDINRARTILASAQAETTRQQALQKEAVQGPTSEEIAAQQGLVQAAKAALKQAELAISRTNIKARAQGVVEARKVSVGDYIESGDEIITLVNKTQPEIYLEIPEQLTNQIKVGTSTSISARALPQWKQEAKVSAVIPATDNRTRRQLVRVNLINSPTGLLPGMAVEGELNLPIAQTNSFLVPRDALTRRGDEWLLFTLDKEQVKEHSVTVVADMGEQMAITNKQLKSGQTIITTGGDGLRDGAIVRVTGGTGESN